CGSLRKVPSFNTVLLLWLALTPAVPLNAQDTVAPLHRLLSTSCEAPSSSLEQMAAQVPESTALAEEPLVVRGVVIGWQRRFGLPQGSEIKIERIAPRAQLRRVVAEYWAAAPDGSLRPELAVVADARCTIRMGRRLLYESNSPQPTAIEHLDQKLVATGVREALNPPVPQGEDPVGIPVAIVDAGVNYLLPEIDQRLARDENGEILGYDYWDMDRRPFDANPARSPFFPQRHGTKTATLLLREAPMARLVPYRYPRPNMSRMGELIRDAAAKGVLIVNMSMGSNKHDDWEAFAAAARANPQMLFVVSAGNDGRDIDTQPVYPAALRLDNAIVVTSAEHTGEIARGSNWGKRSVDLLVPAERLTVTSFDGRQVPASGSSYAAARITALAARLLTKHPRWRAPELKAAIFARALPSLRERSFNVSRGFMPRPDRADRFLPVSNAGEVKEVARHAFKADALYGRSSNKPRRGYTLKPTFAYFEATAWNLDNLRRYAQQAAAILARCEVFIPTIDVRVLAGPEEDRYFRDSSAKQLVRRLALPKPTVYFMRDTLQADAYDAEAIGRSNSVTRPMLRDTVWVTEDIRDPGVALAHELSHILMDSGQHVELQHNLMRAETTPTNTELTPEQCEAIVHAGTENALLTVISNAK
ncbi:MAG: S8 family serine peptidase, partial [Acidiferrobacterales bacterium]|nr:S8 family serine peptidase [Acidiferrobacterales bacterium]